MVSGFRSSSKFHGVLLHGLQTGILTVCGRFPATTGLEFCLCTCGDDDDADDDDDDDYSDYGCEYEYMVMMMDCIALQSIMMVTVR